MYETRRRLEIGAIPRAAQFEKGHSPSATRSADPPVVLSHQTRQEPGQRSTKLSAPPHRSITHASGKSSSAGPMDMDWRSSTTSGTQHPASQYHHHHHHHHSALSAVDTIDLQNFDESANVDLQQLFPSAALGGGGVTAPMTANSFHQHLHAPQLPHSTLYFYTPPPPQSATSSEFFGEGSFLSLASREHVGAAP